MKALKSFAYRPTPGSESLAYFVKALQGHFDDVTELVISHWIWCVKRKAAGLPTEREILISLYGKSDCGKSVAIDKFIAPLEELSAPMSIDNIIQSKYAESYFSHLIGRIELGKNDYSPHTIERLKNCITSPLINFTPIHSSQMYNVPNRTSFIATSNRRLKEVIKDSQMRRFYEIQCQDKMDWDMINGINFLSIWKSVNENAPSPLTQNPALYRKLQKIQNLL